MIEKKTVLVVEDEEILRGALVEGLHIKNLLTLEAKNGREAVEIALSKYPDLILLDLFLPEMDGMSALKEIRKDMWGRGVPVIILTNVTATSEQLISDMVTYKPVSYLIKADWKIDDITESVIKTLEEKHPAGA